jgi:plasmid stabilization system protein ParE
MRGSRSAALDGPGRAVAASAFRLLSILEQLSDVAGPRTARAYDNDFKQTIENLSTFPGTGTPHSHIGPETRIASVEPYLISYDGGPQSDVVHVLRILHGHRDITPEMVARGRRG